MKKNNSLIVIAVLLIASIIVSCSSEKGLTVEKRHYRKGYSIAWHGNKTNVEQKSKTGEIIGTLTSTQAEIKPAETSIQSAACVTETVLTASRDLVPIAFTPVEKSAKSDEAAKSTVVKENKTASIIASKKYTKADRKEIRKFLSKKAPGDTDIPLWAYILFAIILPPLAVGLYEGIHLPFWLSILLSFFFWLPGVIYAIWRVTK